MYHEDEICSAPSAAAPPQPPTRRWKHLNSCQLQRFEMRLMLSRIFRSPTFGGAHTHTQVHSLDSEEGDALQRLIRAVNCNFLALSATIGNAQQVRTDNGISCLERTVAEVLSRVCVEAGPLQGRMHRLMRGR